jgi:hypothetical protein
MYVPVHVGSADLRFIQGSVYTRIGAIVKDVIEDPTISGIASIEAIEAVAYIKKVYNKKFKKCFKNNKM